MPRRSSEKWHLDQEVAFDKSLAEFGPFSYEILGVVGVRIIYLYCGVSCIVYLFAVCPIDDYRLALCPA